jgi:hypothetical protein
MIEYKLKNKKEKDKTTGTERRGMKQSRGSIPRRGASLLPSLDPLESLLSGRSGLQSRSICVKNNFYVLQNDSLEAMNMVIIICLMLRYYVEVVRVVNELLTASTAQSLS